MKCLTAALVVLVALSLEPSEVAGRCKDYCDRYDTGEGTKPCTERQTRQGTSYRSCGFLWASRCKKGTYVCTYSLDTVAQNPSLILNLTTLSRNNSIFVNLHAIWFAPGPPSKNYYCHLQNEDLQFIIIHCIWITLTQFKIRVFWIFSDSNVMLSFNVTVVMY